MIATSMPLQVWNLHKQLKYFHPIQNNCYFADKLLVKFKKVKSLMEVTVFDDEGKEHTTLNEIPLTVGEFVSVIEELKQNIK